MEKINQLFVACIPLRFELLPKHNHFVKLLLKSLQKKYEMEKKAYWNSIYQLKIEYFYNPEYLNLIFVLLIIQNLVLRLNFLEKNQVKNIYLTNIEFAEVFLDLDFLQHKSSQKKGMSLIEMKKTIEIYTKKLNKTTDKETNIGIFLGYNLNLKILWKVKIFKKIWS